MGIQTEYNPDLALRNFSEFRKGVRKREECIPDDLKAGQVIGFLKNGQRNYWLHGEIPLLETDGKGHLSKPIASIIILEATHFLRNGDVWTKGKYKVVQVFGQGDKKIHFDGFARV
jgi:hypothetical protein